MEQVLEVDIPGNEWLTANDRFMPLARASRVAALRLRAAYLARSQGMKPMTGLVRIVAVIHPRVTRRSDPANAADSTKPLVDGLRDAGVLIDDDYMHVVGPEHLQGEMLRSLPVGFHRIVLTLTEIGGDLS